MENVKEMQVYDYAWKEDYDKQARGKKIGVRLVDIDKGTKVRIRLVAQEFEYAEVCDDLFAGTLSLAATKVLLSDFASGGNSEPNKKQTYDI